MIERDFNKKTRKRLMEDSIGLKASVGSHLWILIKAISIFNGIGKSMNRSVGVYYKIQFDNCLLSSMYWVNKSYQLN